MKIAYALYCFQVWGLICGDGWSLLEGAVVCNQLGMGFAQDAPQTDYFGGKVGDLIASGIKCSGQEQELEECFHDEIQKNTTVFCPGNGKNFATVICTDRKQFTDKLQLHVIFTTILIYINPFRQSIQCLNF